MPVKWDARTDQILLLKILETSAVSADVKAISDAWPTSEAEKPTPRAVTERLGKIRKDVKGGTGSFKVSGQKAAMLTSDVTPQKRAPRGSKTGFGSSPGVKRTTGLNGAGGRMLNGNGKRGHDADGFLDGNDAVDDESIKGSDKDDDDDARSQTLPLGENDNPSEDKPANKKTKVKKEAHEENGLRNGQRGHGSGGFGYGAAWVDGTEAEDGYSGGNFFA